MSEITDSKACRAHGVENVRRSANDELVSRYLEVFAFDSQVGEFVVVEKTAQAISHFLTTIESFLNNGQLEKSRPGQSRNFVLMPQTRTSKLRFFLGTCLQLIDCQRYMAP